MHDSQIGEGRGDDVGKRDQLGSQDMGDLGKGERLRSESSTG